MLKLATYILVTQDVKRKLSRLYVIFDFQTSMEQSHYIDTQQRFLAGMQPKLRSQHWEHLYVIVLK